MKVAGLASDMKQIHILKSGESIDKLNEEIFETVLAIACYIENMFGA